MSALPSTSSRMLRVEPSTPVDRATEAPSTTVNSHDATALVAVDVAPLISLALARAGLSHKEAALTMGLDPAQWSRQLAGQGAHISFQRLALLPPAFWREFLPLLADLHQLTVSSQDLLDAAMLRLADTVQAFAVFFIQARATRKVA